MTLVKYRMIIGEGFAETLSLEEAQLSGYQYVMITEDIVETVSEEI